MGYISRLYLLSLVLLRYCAGVSLPVWMREETCIMGAMVHGLPLTRLHAVDIFADPPSVGYRKVATVGSH